MIRRRWAELWPVLALVLLTPVGRDVHAQSGVDTRLTVAANSRDKSAVFDLLPTTQLRVRLVQAPSAADGVVRVYVFEESGVLSALDDPEIASDTFTFQPAAAGRYFVVVVNTNSGPATVQIQTLRTRGTGTARNFAVVRVLYATNRQRLGDGTVGFGADPAADLSYGYTDVSIPRDHRMGELEAPSIWRLELRENPEKHVVILRTQTESAAEFYQQVSARLSESSGRQVLVFVHGFNQTFEEAGRRTAQLAYDLAFDGPAIAFSWPSQGRVVDYLKDQRNAELSAEPLERFLVQLKGSSKQITIHLVAHSMGNRVLARALEKLGESAQVARAKPLREVAMMAPDLDADLFRQASARIAASAERVTLYASSQDSALQAARGLAGYPRAGDGGQNVVVVPGIETVDASSVQTGLLGLGHSYYADNSTILSDLFGLIRGRRPEDRFGLEPVTVASGRYWRFRPAVR